MSKFSQHFNYIYSMLPEITSAFGFILYSFLTYLFVLFCGWLLNPTVDKIIQDDIKNQKLRDKGARMREENVRIRDKLE